MSDTPTPEITQEAAHTPGPWRLDGGVVRGTKLDGKERPIAEIYRELRSTDETIANARLIAAAPDLLAALKDMLSGWQYIRRNHGDMYGVGWDRAEAAATAAIALATGGEARS